MPKFSLAYGSDPKTVEMFTRKNWELVDQENANVIVFTGGTDINPSIYGASDSQNNHYDNERDRQEREIYKKYSRNKRFIGICRGFQFLSCMSGGWLAQDADGHRGKPHNIYYHVEIGAGANSIVNSFHHQIVLAHEEIYPLAVAEEATYMQSEDGRYAPQAGRHLEIEMGFTAGRHYGVQFHPEWCPKSEEIFWKGYDYWKNGYLYREDKEIF